jgi:thiamine biosynthesis lipoprotein ApbE
LVYEDKTLVNKIINNYHKQILDFEKEFSRFREDSTLSKLNKLKKLEVSDDFLILINKSREIYKLTN